MEKGEIREKLKPAFFFSRCHFRRRWRKKSGAAELSSSEKDKRRKSLRCGSGGEKVREIKNGYLSLSGKRIDDDDDGSKLGRDGGGRGRGKQGVIREREIEIKRGYHLLSAPALAPHPILTR